tara:strand:+ start:1020 stop:2516 length:1497 start_codon:yes stop_codon:yes gene_type:complete
MGVLSPQFGNLIPSPTAQALSSNYLQFNSAAGGGTFAQQYLPEIYEAEIERYGNRTLGGFLRMVGAEMPMTSDQVIWSEQNRLHISYDGCSRLANNFTININPGAVAGITNVLATNMTVVIMDPTKPGATIHGFVGNVGAAAAGGAGGVNSVDVYPYDAASLIGLSLTGLKLFVYGSEFAKGTLGSTENIQPSFTQYSNAPIIIKSNYQVSGSDTAQIGWVEVAAEDGTSGFLWYLKAEGETRLRFEDYLEMSMVEGERALSFGGGGADLSFLNQAVAGNLPAASGFGAAVQGAGTQGLFSAINTRGNVMAGFGGSLQDFDDILMNLDSQGAIEENMLFLDRATELQFDNMLAQQNSYGAGGTSYGVFENSEEMALNLGFSGFRRGSYDFYKTSWKYLNDASTRGGSTNFTSGDNIDGVLIPAGTSTVYDQLLGTNIRRPFLHVRYRASQADDRRMKSWITGSVGGVYTNTSDSMQVSFLSERCLCTQAANNFVLFTA